MTSQEQGYRNRKGEDPVLLSLQHTNEVVNAFDVFFPMLRKVVVAQENQNYRQDRFLEKKKRLVLTDSAEYEQEINLPVCFSKLGDAKAFSSGVISVEDFVVSSLGERFVSVIVHCWLPPRCFINKCHVLDIQGKYGFY